MATHSSILAWRIPGTEEPSGLPSTGSHRVGCDWSDLAAAAATETPTNVVFSKSQHGGRTMAPVLASRHPECTASVIWYPAATLNHTPCFNTQNSAKVMSPEQGIQHFQSYFVRIFILKKCIQCYISTTKFIAFEWCWFQPGSNLVALSAKTKKINYIKGNDHWILNQHTASKYPCVSDFWAHHEFDSSINGNHIHHNWHSKAFYYTTAFLFFSHFNLRRYFILLPFCLYKTFTFCPASSKLEIPMVFICPPPRIFN